MGMYKCAVLCLITSVFISYVPIIRLFVDFEKFDPEDPQWIEVTKVRGQYMKLFLGNVHYILEGKEDAPLVVMLHGISSSSYSLVNISASLQEAGFRTLLMDFYGRGHSDSPTNVVHNEDFFVNQLLEIMEKLLSEGKITPEQHRRHHLLGWSLGGAVSLVYAARFPQKIKSATLIAPPGMPFDVGVTGRLVQVPGIGELLGVGDLGRFMTESRIPRAFVHPEEVPHAVRALKILNVFLIQKEGFISAFLSSLRNFKLNGLTPVYNKVGQEKFPILLVWGDKDATVPLHCGYEAVKHIPRAELVVIKDSGHCVFMEKPQEVIPKITQFVSNSEKQSQ